MEVPYPVEAGRYAASRQALQAAHTPSWSSGAGEAFKMFINQGGSELERALERAWGWGAVVWIALGIGVIAAWAAGVFIGIGG